MSDEQNILKIRNWVAALIVTILLAASGQAIVVVSSITELRANYNHMKSELSDMKHEVRSMIATGMQKRYTSEDATEDKRAMIELIQSVNARVAVSERRLDLLEDKVR